MTIIIERLLIRSYSEEEALAFQTSSYALTRDEWDRGPGAA